MDGERPLDRDPCRPSDHRRGQLPPAVPRPRIVAGLPIAVVDDEGEGRRAAAEIFAGYGVLPNYRRILDIGEVDGPG